VGLHYVQYYKHSGNGLENIFPIFMKILLSNFNNLKII